MYTLRAVDTNGTMPGDGLLGDYKDLKSNVTFTDIGDMQFDYPVNGANAGKLTQQRELALFDDSGEVPDSRCIIEDRNGNMVSKDGVLYRSWQGRNLWKCFADAIVYPSDWPTNPSATAGRSFASSTPGVILKTLIDSSQARGELTGITYNFTNTVDSSSEAWAFQLSIGYDAGVNLLQILQNLIDQGVIECRMVGRQLQVYNPENLGTDRTLTNPPLVLWTGRNVDEMPEQEISRELKNVALVQGDDNFFVEVTDAGSISQWNRRALFISQGGVTDTGTLTIIGQANIDRIKQPRKERTASFSINDVVPHRAFIPGDWIYSGPYEVNAWWAGGLERMRVRQIVLEVESATDAGQCIVTLNDKFMELEIILNRKVEGITGGATLGGGSSAIPTDPATQGDIVAPKVPTGLQLNSGFYVDSNGIAAAAMVASWNEVTQNQDETACTDLDTYVVAWKYNTDTDWQPLIFSEATTATWSPVLTGRNVTGKVGAYDTNGNFSGWSTTVGHLTDTDDQPPPTPSTPQVTAYLGQLKIWWDGLGSSGQAMPADLAACEVHISVNSGFTPDNNTMIYQLVGRGTAIATDLTYGTPYYVKLRARDRSGNYSAASTQASATPERVVADDIVDNIISTVKLADDAVTGPKIAAGQVVTSHLVVGGLTDSIVMNGGMEEADPESALPARWMPSWWSGNGGVITRNTSSPIAGQADMKIVLAAQTDGMRCASNSVAAVRPGEVYYVTAKYKASRSITATCMELHFCTHSTNDVYGIGGGQTWTTLIDTGGSTTLATFEGNVTIPAGHYFAGIAVSCMTADAGGGYTGYWDDVYARKLVGTAEILDAAINTAKIADLAVNDAKIANLDGGKIDALSITTEQFAVGTVRTNICPNPGFEEQWGWNGLWYPRGGSTGYYDASLTYVRSGRRSWKLSALTGGQIGGLDTGGYAWCDFIPVVEGHEYRVQWFWCADQVLTHGMFARVEYAQDQQGTGSSGDVLLTAGDFENVGTDVLTMQDALENGSTLTVPTGQGYDWMRVKFYLWNPDGTAPSIWIDDVAIVEVGQGAVLVDGSGIRMWDGTGDQVLSLVTNDASGNYIMVNDNGQTIASVSGAGDISGQYGSLNQGLEIYGLELMNGSTFQSYHPGWVGGYVDNILDAAPRGVIAHDWIGTMYEVVDPTERGLVGLDCPMEPYRMYMIVGHIWCVPNAAARAQISLRYTQDGSVPKVNSSLLSSFNYVTGDSNYGSMPFNGVIRSAAMTPDGNGEYMPTRLLLSGRILSGGSGTMYMGGSAFAGYGTWRVQDIGPYIPETGYRNDGSVMNPAVKKTYVKRFYATWSRSFKGDGTYNSYYGQECTQGYYSSNNGNQRSMVGFDYSAIQSALSGSVVNSCKLYAYANHWYWHSGGTAVIGTHNVASAPATFSGTTNRKQSSRWPKPGGRVVNLGTTIGNEFKNNTAKGIVFGPGPSTNKIYYGHFNGNGSSYEPYLEFTYTK